MSNVFYLMLVSGALLFVLVLLFRAESVSQRRYFLSGLRGRADHYLEKNTLSILRVKKVFGASSLRLFLHYALHQVLSAVLYVVRFIEERLHHLRLKNKVVAKVIKAKSEDNHLFHIARHKDATTLSAEEQDRIRERSLDYWL